MQEPGASRLSQISSSPQVRTALASSAPFSAPIKPIVVIGSINMDMVCRTPHMPRPGQTILGSDFVTIPGGKGANQAVAAAKLAGAKPPPGGSSGSSGSSAPAGSGGITPGDAVSIPSSISEDASGASRRGNGDEDSRSSGPSVYMVGRLGNDDFGQRLLNGLIRHGVRTEYVTISEGVASGCATILVDAAGENSIVVVPGANAMLQPADIDAAEKIIASAACIVVQLEIPLATVQYAIDMAHRHGVLTILDPAPVPEQGLPNALLAVDVLTPNQSEAEQLVGLPPTHHVKTQKILDPKQVGTELVSRGAKRVALKLGAGGALVLGREQRIERIEAFKTNVVDTTAAGDAFTGALAVALAEGKAFAEAVRFANAAGAICCQTFGAQPALPARQAVDMLLNRQ